MSHYSDEQNELEENYKKEIKEKINIMIKPLSLEELEYIQNVIINIREYRAFENHLSKLVK